MARAAQKYDQALMLLGGDRLGKVGFEGQRATRGQRGRAVGVVLREESLSRPQRKTKKEAQASGCVWIDE
jgi:hypothetical protein